MEMERRHEEELRKLKANMNNWRLISDSHRAKSTLLIHCLSALKGNHTPDAQSTLKIIQVFPTNTVQSSILLVNTLLSIVSWKLPYP